MGLQKEVWAKDIVKGLFANNEFAKLGTDHSSYVSNKVVHVPQSGVNPNVVINRSVLPAVAAERTDAELTYLINEFTTDPIVVRDVDETQTSYAKRQSVLMGHMDAMNDALGDQTAYDWAVSGTAENTNVIRTTGTATATALSSSATGTRKELTRADVRNLARKFDVQNVPANDRYLLLDTQMFYQLFADDVLMNRDFMEKSSIEKGYITEIHGFKILKRSKVVIYTNATDPVKKAIGAAGAVTDNLGCIAWQKSSVASAMGGVKTYADENKPEWFGSVFSAMVLFGAAKIRTDLKGIGAIIQAA